MRIIAGRYRGRRLQAPRGRTTRPTSDRVREALFAMLGDIDGARVLDLFAGTGALGIEALSRGAAQAVFVERDAAALGALQRNLVALGLEGGEEAEPTSRAPLYSQSGGEEAEPTSRASLYSRSDVPVVEVRRGEARTALRAALAREETYDLVFVDPPYGDAQAWGRELPAALGPLLVHAGRIVVESNRRTPLELRLAGVSEARKRRHGDTIITIYTIDKG